MKQFLARFGTFIPLALTILLGTGAIVWAVQNHEGELEVAVKVTESFRWNGILQSDPKATVSVVKEAGRWKAGDSVVIRSKWPCATEKFACEWNGNWHSAIGEANRDAANLRTGLCYVVTLDRVAAGEANFNSENYDPREVPCSP